MDLSEAGQAVRAALGQVAPEVDLLALPPDADLREVADLDSLDFLRVVEAVAGSTGVDIPEAEYGSVRSLAGMAAYVADHRAAGSGVEREG